MIILPEDKNIVSLVPAEEAQALLLALFSEPGYLPELSPAANIIYTALKSKNDRIVERKSKAGKCGGAPKNNQNAQNKQNKQDVTEQAEGDKTTHRTSTVSVTDTVSGTEGTGDTPPAGDSLACSAEDYLKRRGFARPESGEEIEQFNLLQAMFDCADTFPEPQRQRDKVYKLFEEVLRDYDIDRQRIRGMVLRIRDHNVSPNSRWNKGRPYVRYGQALRDWLDRESNHGHVT